jgi:hypothetical protein
MRGEFKEMWDFFFIKMWRMSLTVFVTGPSQSNPTLVMVGMEKHLKKALWFQ